MYRIFVQILENKSLFQILGWTGSYIEGAWRENFILTRFLVVEFYCITWQKSGLEVAAYAVALRLSDRQIFWLAVMKSWDRHSVKKNGHIYRAEAAGISPCTLRLSQIGLFA